MVILNKEILVCKKSMIKSIKSIMSQVMKKYFDDEILCNNIKNKKKLMEKIIKEKSEETKTNYFWYVNSSSNVCTFIHKRGKKEGHMCHKRICTNIVDNKPDYLCTTHSKLHIPKKRIKKRNSESVIISDCDTKKRKDIKKIKKRKIKPKKVYICNGGLLDLGKIIGKILNEIDYL